MVSRKLCHTLGLLLCGLLPACAQSPSQPDSRCGTVFTLQISCTPQGDGTQCESTGNTYCGAGPTVTAQTTWSSSAPDVVTISSSGFARSIGPGDAEIDGSYQGARGSARLRVLQGQPPLQLYEIDSFVRAAPGCGIHDGISGALVSVTAGLNEGRSATTNSEGAYALPDVVYGPITIKATRVGYQDATVSGGVGTSGISDICMSPAPQ